MNIRRIALALFVMCATLLTGALSPAAQAHGATPPRRVAAAIAPQACSGGIAGAVFASDTDLPLEGVIVTVTLAGTNIMAEATTNASGRYAIGGLPAGAYQVDFTPDPETQAEYLSEIYNQQFDAASANLVAVAAGAVTPNINATLTIGGAISGRVLAADTGEGLSGVVAAISVGDDDPIDEVVTDDNGEYLSDALPTGSYKVTFLPPDGDPAYIQGVYATPVGVVAPEETPNINATLSLGGQIRGRVTAAGTVNGLADVNVEVYTAEGDLLTSTFTDADGNYATSGLRSGSYKLLFDTTNYTTTDAYLPSYYNLRPDLGTADSVAVAVPNATTANIALSKGGQFTGTVTAGGQAREDVEVRVYTGAGELAATATTDVSGKYLTPGLVPGSYKLLFRPADLLANTYAFEYYSNRATLSTAGLLAAPSSGTTSQINAVLDAGGYIGGNVQLAGIDLCSVALSVSGVNITIYDADGRQVAHAQADAGGNYITPALPPGDYRIGFEGPEGLGFRATFYNNQSTLEQATPITIGGPGSAPDINATLAQGNVYLPLLSR